MNLFLILKSINYIEAIGNKKLNISDFIDINFNNTARNNVMWLSKKNLKNIIKIKTGIIICPIINDIKDLKNRKNITFIQCENPRREFSRAQKIFLKFKKF